MFTNHDAVDEAMEVGLVPPASWAQIQQKRAELQQRAAAKQLWKERFAALLAKFNRLFGK